MVIIGPKSEFGREVERASEWAPNLAAHRRAMLWWQKMNAVDAEVTKSLLAPIAALGGKTEWFYSIPLGVATILTHTRPELFFDTTGKAMRAFLQSDEGRPYRVPGNKVVPV